MPILPTAHKASIGFGKKFTFESIANKNPSPFQYTIDPKLKKTQGFSFGLGRSVYDFLNSEY